MGDIAVSGRPSIETGHYFGLDEIGRDLYARTIQATRTSLVVGVIGALVAIMIGTLYGAVPGFVGGWLDNAMMRTVDVLVSIPYIVAATVVGIVWTWGILVLWWILG